MKSLHSDFILPTTLLAVFVVQKSVVSENFPFLRDPWIYFWAVVTT